MNQKLVALVTGANKGIGYEVAKELAARDYTVLVGARDAALGTAAAASIGGDARALTLDVTDAQSIAAAAARIERELGRLDVLVNNAGIFRTTAPGAAALSDVRAVFETNVFGVIAVTQALLPLLRAAPMGRIVNVSSSVGSLTQLSEPDGAYAAASGLAYGPSKSALNAVTIVLAHELAGTRIKVNAVCPGYTATDLNAHSGTRSVQQAAQEPVLFALLGHEGPTGGFTNDQGRVAW